MALTEYDKKILNKEGQAGIEAATKKWNEAYAKGDKAGMDAASKEAAAIRNNAGYKTDSSGNYTGSYTPKKNSQYTIGSDAGKKQAQNMGVGASWVAPDGSKWVKENDGTITVNHNGTTSKNAWAPTDLGIAGMQMVEAGVPYEYVQNVMNARLNKALNNEELSDYAYDYKYWTMRKYIEDAMGKENQQDAQDMFNAWLAQYEKDNRQQKYNSKYDKKIDKLLKEILNRDDFSYDAMSDPLYQQFAQMYRREGDRAMKETLAEAAAGAGGMNTYAITAAQQANNYYNSQLNDKIPELYQLAYEMYLNDKESKVQDLGILKDMDATQYGRYRDTMTDYYNDKYFAYGAFQDAVQQGNWQTNFDNNSLMNNQEFIYNDLWKNKEWDATTDGMDEATINLAIEQAKAGQTATGSGGGGGNGYTGGNGNGNGGKEEEEIDTTQLGIGPINYETLAELVASGAVILNSNGVAEWAEGYSAENFQGTINNYYKNSLFPGLNTVPFWTN